MAAANTDKLLQVVANTGWQIGAGGVADGSVTTIPLVSGAGLPTDTAVLLTIDRVDSGGNQTPSNMERVIGVVSGNNVVNCTRGVEGTAQAHSGGAVVEVVIASPNINKLIEHLLTEHNQDGSHHFESAPAIKEESDTPDTPDSGYQKIYTKTDGKIYRLDDEGNEEEIGMAIPELATYTPSAGGSQELDLSTGKRHAVTMPSGNVTLTIANATLGQVFLVEITQDGTGSRTVTWFSTIRWAGGSAPTLTTTGNKRDVFGFIVTGSGTYDGFVVGQNL